jgi:DNA polymerase-3 subunit alpha
MTYCSALAQIKNVTKKTAGNCMAINFILRAAGKEKINYPDPCLEEILRETYGIIVYQEQVMRIIQRVAGYSLVEADLLLRIMKINRVNKNHEQLDRETEKFFAGAMANGFNKTKAAELFDILLHFTRFSFNKSHTAAYTKIAYQTAYLKANFPAEFTAVFCSGDDEISF